MRKPFTSTAVQCNTSRLKVGPILTNFDNAEQWRSSDGHGSKLHSSNTFGSGIQKFSLDIEKSVSHELGGDTAAPTTPV
jgi:hypothetical protein